MIVLLLATGLAAAEQVRRTSNGGAGTARVRYAAGTVTIGVAPGQAATLDGQLQQTAPAAPPSGAPGATQRAAAAHGPRAPGEH